jgi:hypothetical protein
MTNDLGHCCAQHHGPTTLGAYRHGGCMPWVPGATIDVWVACARQVIDVAWPHAYFIQTIGGRTADDGSIYCPTCRAEVAAARAAGIVTVKPPAIAASKPAVSKPKPQSDLPF